VKRVDRVTTNLYPAVKNQINDLKDILKLKSESEVVGYLYAIYEAHYPKLTVIEHNKALERMTELHNQITL
jgi:hypothetical protein